MGAEARAAPTISVVIGCRNEEENVGPMTDAVRSELERLGLTFELIYIDNASVDRTVEIVKGLCAQDRRVKLIVNQGNFGQLRSPVHALYQASGEAVIGLCADFQDPPTMIPELIRHWREGYPIVLGVRQTERTGLLLGAVRRIGYRMAGRMLDYPLIPNATGFGLYDREVVREIARLREPEPLWRALLVEFGWPIKTLEYARPPRARGRTNNNFLTLLDFTLSAMSGSAKKLLRVPFFVGFASLLASLGLAVAAVLAAPGVARWALVVLSVLQLNVALLLIVAGVIGDQVRLLAERTRGTPLVVEAERVNFD